MKEQIKQLIESQHMNQKVFADYIGIASATISGILNDRTRPTMNVVEAIKKKFPDINLEWLIFGKEPMFESQEVPSEGQTPLPPTVGNSFNGTPVGVSVRESVIDFGASPAPGPQSVHPSPSYYNGVRNTHQDYKREEVKIIDKPPRRVTEIRVYYDDQTWESFVPSKK